MFSKTEFENGGMVHALDIIQHILRLEAIAVALDVGGNAWGLAPTGGAGRRRHAEKAEDVTVKAGKG